jgi:hypothetical protein
MIYSTVIHKDLEIWEYVSVMKKHGEPYVPYKNPGNDLVTATTMKTKNLHLHRL